MKKLFIETYGCQMNVADSEVVASIMKMADYEQCDSIDEADAVLLFPYLKEGKYSIRITEDLNRNGIVDTGNLLEHKQPEKVKFFKLRDGTFLITIKESTEMEQKIDVAKLFEN